MSTRSASFVALLTAVGACYAGAPPPTAAPEPAVAPQPAAAPAPVPAASDSAPTGDTSGGLIGNQIGEVIGSGGLGLSESPHRDSPNMRSKDQLRSFILQHSGPIRGCYQRQLTQQSDLKGKVTARFTIEASGAVSDATAEGMSPAMDDCVLREIKTWQFPPAADSTHIEYPFLFTNA